jgi:beta-glucanase (GH16 family)
MYLENGMLVIEARKEKVKDAYGEYYYTSTRINTENKFKVKYGKIEARAKFPYGKGLWPAIWLLGSNFRYVGWPMCGEIDIVEFLGHDRYTVYGTIHGPGYSKDKAKSWKYRLDMDEPDFTEEFHRFGIIWDDKKISFYVDDTVYYTVKKEVILKQGYPWVFDNEFFLIVNLAVGGYWPGYPDNTTKFPARMYVDYIKVWQKVE